MKGSSITSGISASRNPENPKTFLIARGIAPEQVLKEDLLEVDLDGKVLTQTKDSPYSERFIHRAIYAARPEVNSVIHAHPEELVILSVLDMPVRFIQHPSTIFHSGVPGLRRIRFQEQRDADQNEGRRGECGPQSWQARWEI